jgi:hypothetical protein
MTNAELDAAHCVQEAHAVQDRRQCSFLTALFEVCAGDVEEVAQILKLAARHDERVRLELEKIA